VPCEFMTDAVAREVLLVYVEDAPTTRFCCFGPFNTRSCLAP